MMKFHFLLLLFTSQIAFSQNLVLNPSFEDFEGCPEVPGDFLLLENWEVVGDASPDLFSICSHNYLTGAPVNIAGKQYPYNGNSYAGFMCYHEEKDWREFLLGEFSEPLEAGKVYEFSFYHSVGEMTDYFTDQIGVTFSEDPFSNAQSIYNSVNGNNTKVNIPGKYFEQTDKWQLFTKSYTAKGGEQFFAIGNFTLIKTEADPKVNPLVGRDIIEGMGYLYVDAVRMIEHQAEEIKPWNTNARANDTLMTQHKFHLALSDDIFLGDSEQIIDEKQLGKHYGEDLSSQVILLDYLLFWLKRNPQITVDFHVHTDKSMTEEAAKSLTQKQASALVAYFDINGISTDRLNATGQGNQFPISDEQPTYENRRIEVVMTRQ